MTRRRAILAALVGGLPAGLLEAAPGVARSPARERSPLLGLLARLPSTANATGAGLLRFGYADVAFMRYVARMPPADNPVTFRAVGGWQVLEAAVALDQPTLTRLRDGDDDPSRLAAALAVGQPLRTVQLVRVDDALPVTDAATQPNRGAIALLVGALGGEPEGRGIVQLAGAAPGWPGAVDGAWGRALPPVIVGAAQIVRPDGERHDRLAMVFDGIEDARLAATRIPEAFMAVIVDSSLVRDTAVAAQPTGAAPSIRIYEPGDSRAVLILDAPVGDLPRGTARTPFFDSWRALLVAAS